MYRNLQNDAPDGATGLLARYAAVRALSERLAAPLSSEDCCIQSMPDASPTKWHLAHTTWFFETFVLVPELADYEVYETRFAYLFNSYYEALGPRHSRPKRGLLTRPDLNEVYAYRRHVDAAIAKLIESTGQAQLLRLEPLIELGLHHEQQHQELILTDIKHAFWLNPLLPSYMPVVPTAVQSAAPHEWHDFGGGIVPVGREGEGFAFDNEKPRHLVLLAPYRLSSRAVTCGDYLAFMEDGGYQRPEFWLSDGWAAAEANAWEAPLYWKRDGKKWRIFTLNGVRALKADEPVVHVSFYEAAAYAAWAKKRLPTEFEWEAAAIQQPVAGNFLDPRDAHPKPASETSFTQMFGDVWEWTRSSYEPYPGFKPFEGAASEYNGKFMSGQMVLRGGSCATPEGHIRPSYRNFFPPAARWQFSGIRLADDA
jgi:ergothioneine biosynthesis protein EgtB